MIRDMKIKQERKMQDKIMETIYEAERHVEILKLDIGFLISSIDLLRKAGGREKDFESPASKHFYNVHIEKMKEYMDFYKG